MFFLIYFDRQLSIYILFWLCLCLCLLYSKFQRIQCQMKLMVQNWEKKVDAKTESDLNICPNVGQDDIDTNMKNNYNKSFDLIQKSKTTLTPVENPKTCKF